MAVWLFCAHKNVICGPHSAVQVWDHIPPENYNPSGQSLMAERIAIACLGTGRWADMETYVQKVV